MERSTAAVTTSSHSRFFIGDTMKRTDTQRSYDVQRSRLLVSIMRKIRERRFEQITPEEKLAHEEWLGAGRLIHDAPRS